TATTLAETCAHIRKAIGREVFHQALDVTDSPAVASLVGAVETHFGRLDICVTNSGGPPSNSFRNTKPEDWRSTVDQLLMSTIFFAREGLPRMQKNKWGRLITITSSAVKQPVDGLVLSNSVRAAVTGLARTLANEYAADGITVNNVCPGYTRTARLDGLASTISARTGAKPDSGLFASPHPCFAPMSRTPARATTICSIPASLCASTSNRKKSWATSRIRFPFFATGLPKWPSIPSDSPSTALPSTNPLRDSKLPPTNSLFLYPPPKRVTNLTSPSATKANPPKACTSFFPTRIIPTAPSKFGPRANPRTRATTFPPTTTPTIASPPKRFLLFPRPGSLFRMASSSVLPTPAKV